MPLLLKTRLYLASAVILLAGLSCSVWIYLTAGDDTDAALVEEMIDTRKYAHDLALYGGKLSVLTDELTRWFAGLWQGRQLALTVAVITVAISLGIFLVARSNPSGPAEY